jgi:hypothetical protein
MRCREVLVLLLAGREAGAGFLHRLGGIRGEVEDGYEFGFRVGMQHSSGLQFRVLGLESKGLGLIFRVDD